jgi:hypothetical protein
MATIVTKMDTDTIRKAYALSNYAKSKAYAENKAS